ncbi:MAG TPA: glycosyltransferase family 39 protein, partial [Pyrinomonadaceae bacterium]|nr:glycosyltransferase family 39 protein [Pyrinomonadaceae bacterium]
MTLEDDDEHAHGQTLDAPALRVNAEDDERFGRGARAVFALAVLLCAVLRLWRLNGSCLWFDELFGVHAARHGWGGMFGFVVADIIHPPLFYVLLKLWIALGGESLSWLRLLPALTAIATLVPFALLCRELRLRPVELNLAMLLFALNGYLIKYAQEVRMYSLLLFLAVCSLWIFVRYYNSPRVLKKHLAALLSVNLLLVYTHYYGWLLVAAQFVFLLIYAARRKLLPFAGAICFVAVCFSPWAYAVAQAQAAGHGLAQNIGWAVRPDASHVAQFYFTLNEILYYVQSSNERLYLRWSVVLGALVFGCPLVWYVWRTLRRTQDAANARALPWLVIFSVLPVALAFLLSWILPYSVWGTRHLIIIAAPYLILCATALARLRPFWLRTTLLILLGCWTLLSATVLLVSRERNYVWCAWETLARRAVESEPARDPPLKIYAFEDLVAY